jgi:hypothetical protein
MTERREATVGKATIRMLRQGATYRGVVIHGNEIRSREEGGRADDVWRRLHDAAGRLSPGYFGFDGARKRFLGFFPEGFRSPAYAAMERDYKVRAKAKLDSGAPLEAALSGSGFGEAVLSAYQATNLLSRFEKTRLQDILRSPGADCFIQAAATFAEGEVRRGLLGMEQALRPHDSARWTVVTYLPYLWRPDLHMFLKPRVTREFAERVGHAFAHRYEPRLTANVYESLLDLVTVTEGRISDLEPRDRIDVQSFIWIVGGYEDDAEVRMP